jgi:hypothetical protein
VTAGFDRSIDPPCTSMRRWHYQISFLMVLAVVGVLPTRSAVSGDTEGIGVWDPDGLVAQLRSMPPILTPYAGGGVCGDPCVLPPLPPVEEKRKQIYDLLYSFSTASVPALARLLQSGDVNGKRNALLALDVLGGGWYFAGPEPAQIDISAALPALVIALGDSDSTVRGWAAESIGYVGAPAVE